jgi:hypothetical protein
MRSDQRTYVTRFLIPPKLLTTESLNIEGTDLKVLTLVLFRKKSFREIGCFKLSHNCSNGNVFISKLEIQEPKSGICLTVVINQFIREWTPNSKPISVKTIQLKKDKTLISDLRMTYLLNFYDYWALLLIRSHLILLLTISFVSCYHTFCSYFDN